MNDLFNAESRLFNAESRLFNGESREGSRLYKRLALSKFTINYLPTGIY